MQVHREFQAGWQNSSTLGKGTPLGTVRTPLGRYTADLWARVHSLWVKHLMPGDITIPLWAGTTLDRSSACWEILWYNKYVRYIASHLTLSRNAPVDLCRETRHENERNRILLAPLGSANVSCTYLGLIPCKFGGTGSPSFLLKFLIVWRLINKCVGSLIIQVSRCEFVLIKDNANRMVRLWFILCIYCVDRKLLTYFSSK